VKTIKLSKPVLVGSGEDGDVKKVEELVFREEIVAGDLRGIPMRDPPFWDDLLKIAGRLCGQPDVVINKLSFQDANEVAALVGGFTGVGQPTGNKPSP
jgi:hypothetical protein